MNKDKAFGCVIGAAIGDALGSPFEFLSQSDIAAHNIEKQYDYSYYLRGVPGSLMSNHRAGDVSDDTYMSLGVLIGLYTESKVLNKKVTTEEFVKWTKGPRFGVSAPGTTTTRALYQGHSIPSEGNGAVMKAQVPAAMIDDPLEAVSAAIDVAQITHKSQSEEENNEMYAALTVLFCKYAAEVYTPGHSILDFEAYAKSVNPQIDYCKFENDFMKYTKLHDKGRDVSCWSLETCIAAISAFYDGISGGFSNVIASAIKLGGDTDTVANSAGAFAGAYFGLEYIKTNHPSLFKFNIQDEIMGLAEDCWSRKEKIKSVVKI